jgi:GxxExxY protein
VEHHSVDIKYQESKHQALIEKVITIFHRVYSMLGYGFQEKVYKDAMMIELKKAGIHSTSQSGIRIFYQGKIIDEHYADILVDNQVIVKITAERDLGEDDKVQILHCVEVTNYKVGILFNFGTKPDVALIY